MSTIRDRRKQNMVNGNVTRYKSIGKRTRLLAVFLIISLAFTGLSGVGNYQVYADEEDTGSGNINQEDITDYIDDYGITHLKDGSISLPSDTVTASNGMIIVPSGYVLSSGEDGFVDEGILTDGKLVLSDGSTIYSDGSIELPDNSGDVYEEENVPEEDATPDESDNEAIISAIKTKITFITSSAYFLNNVMGIEDIDNSNVSDDECLSALAGIIEEYASYDDLDEDYSSLLTYIKDSDALSDEWLNGKDAEYLSLLNSMLNEIYGLMSDMPTLMTISPDGNCVGEIHDDGSIHDGEIHTNCTIKSGTFDNCSFDGCNIETVADTVFRNSYFNGTKSVKIVHKCEMLDNTVFTNSECEITLEPYAVFKAENVSFTNNNSGSHHVILIESAGNPAKCDLLNCTFSNNNTPISANTECELNINDCFFDSNTNCFAAEPYTSDIRLANGGSNINISGCTFIGHSESIAVNAITNLSEHLKINDSSFTNYSSSGDGAAIRSYVTAISATLKIKNTTFTNCQANKGGAIYSEEDIEIENSSFSNCQANNGGAIYLVNEANSTIKDSTFSGNTASLSGGAIEADSNVVLENTSISNNTVSNGDSSKYYGGGINVLSNGKVRLEGNTIVTGNKSNGKADDICYPIGLANESGKFTHLELSKFNGEAYLQRSDKYTGSDTNLTEYFGDINVTADDTSEGILGINDNEGVIEKFGKGKFKFVKFVNYFRLLKYKPITRVELGLNTKEILRFDDFDLINGDGAESPRVVPLKIYYKNADGSEKAVNVDSYGPIKVEYKWIRLPGNIPLTGKSEPTDEGYVINVEVSVTDDGEKAGYSFSRLDPEAEVLWSFAKKSGTTWISDGANIKDTSEKTIEDFHITGLKYIYPVKHLKATEGGFKVDASVVPKITSSSVSLYDKIDISFDVDTDNDSVKELPDTLTAFLYKKNSSGTYELNNHFEIARSSKGTKVYKGTLDSVTYEELNGDILVDVKCGNYSGDTFIEGKYINDDTEFTGITGVALSTTIGADPLKQDAPTISVKKSIPSEGSGYAELLCDLNNHSVVNTSGLFELYYGESQAALDTFCKSTTPNASTMQYIYEVKDNKQGFYSIRYPDIYYDKSSKSIKCKLKNDKYVLLNGAATTAIESNLIKIADASEWSLSALLSDEPVIATVDYEYKHSGTDKCGIDTEVAITKETFSILDDITAKVSLAPGLSWGELSQSKVGSQLNVEWFAIKDGKEYILKSDTVTSSKNAVTYTVPAVAKAFVNGVSTEIDLTTVSTINFRVLPRTNQSGTTYQSKYEQPAGTLRLHEDTRSKPSIKSFNTTNSTSKDGSVYGKDMAKLLYRTSSTGDWIKVADDEKFKNNELTGLDKGTYYFKYSECDGYKEAKDSNSTTVVIEVGKDKIGALVVTSEHVNSGVCTVEKSPNGDLMVGDKLTAVFALAKGLDWGLLADNGKEIIGSSLTLQYVKYVPELDVNGNIKKDADGNDIYKEVILDTARLTEKKTTAEYYMTADDVGYKIEVRVLPDARDLYHSNAVVMTKQTVGKHTASTKAPVFKPTAETGPGKNDGTITSKEMIDLDYKYSEDGKWIKVSTDKEHFKLTVLEKLKPGKYYFRRSESATNLAGTKIYEVVVEAKAEPSPGVTPMPGSDATGDKIAPDKKSSSSGVRPKVTSENLPEAKITPVIFATPEVVEEEEQIPTKINIEPIDVPNGDDIYLEAKINSSEADLYDALLNEDEKNSERDVKVHLTCTDSDLMLTDEQTDQVRNVAKGYTLGAVLDVGIFKQYDNGSIYQVSQTSDPIEITAHVPTSIQNWDQNIVREYIVVRFHDNEAPVVLPCTYNKLDRTVTFNTDKFSVYVLMYHDNTKALAIGNKVWDLLSTKYILLFFLLLSTFLVALIVWDVKKGNNVYSINL